MSYRRIFAAAASLTLIAVGATACGDDDGGDGGSGGGAAVTVATQSFPEATLVGALYDVLLSENGYDVDVRSVDTRDAYLSEIPGDVDIVPEYLAGLGDNLNTLANGEDAEPITSNDSEATLE